MFTGVMVNTWIAATAVAIIAGVTGFFAVLRGSTFAAHAIPNGAFAGAAGASLLGLNPFAGLAVFSVAGALGIAGLSRRSRPDVATALTFVMMLGIGALFVSWSSQYAQEAYSLLFGEVFGISTDEVLPILVLGALSIAAIAVMFRPLMLSSALPEVAAAAAGPIIRLNISSAPTTGTVMLVARAMTSRNARSIRRGGTPRAAATSGSAEDSMSGRNMTTIAAIDSAPNPRMGTTSSVLTPNTSPNSSE